MVVPRTRSVRAGQKRPHYPNKRTGWLPSNAPGSWLAGIGSSASLVPLPANRSAALAAHEHHTFKDRGEVAGGAYNHKTMQIGV